LPKQKFSYLSKIEPENTQNFILGFACARFLLDWGKMNQKTLNFHSILNWERITLLERELFLLSENYLSWARIISLELDMQKNLHKPAIFMFFLQKLHSTHIFLNLHIKIIVLTQNYWSILAIMLIYTHIYIYIHIYTHIYIHIYTYIYIYIYMCVCLCVFSKLNQHHLKSNKKFSSNITF